MTVDCVNSVTSCFPSRCPRYVYIIILCEAVCQFYLFWIINDCLRITWNLNGTHFVTDIPWCTGTKTGNRAPGCVWRNKNRSIHLFGQYVGTTTLSVVFDRVKHFHSIFLKDARLHSRRVPLLSNDSLRSSMQVMWPWAWLSLLKTIKLNDLNFWCIKRCPRIIP